MGNTWGRLFRVTTWGESHGAGGGAVIDGCPPISPWTILFALPRYRERLAPDYLLAGD